MKIAYLISAYTNAPHLGELVDALYTEDSYFFIHVDKKVDINPFKESTMGRKHISYVEERHRVAWGGWSQVLTQITLIKNAKESGIDFGYFFFISGQDYPVWSNARISEYLSSIGDKELICAKNLCEANKKQRVTYTTIRPFNDYPLRPHTPKSICRVILRKVIKLLGFRKKLEFDADGHHYQLYKGSDWFGFSPRLADFVLDRWRHSTELKKYYKTSFVPSETFIHTLVFNSEYRDKCVLREGDASFNDITLLTFVDYGKQIKILDESDYDRIIKSDKIFCRKVVTGDSDKLKGMIDTYRTKKSNRNNKDTL